MSARPTTAAELAASLRQIAARLDSLGDLVLPGLAPTLFLQLMSDPAEGDFANRVAAVDILAAELDAGKCHYRDGSTSYGLLSAGSELAGIGLSIFAPDAKPDPKDVEIAELRARLAAVEGGAS